MASFNVINLDDSGSGSLRQAILDANTTAGADDIQFSSLSGTITFTSGELLITDSLTINGPGASLLSVSGDNYYTVFDVDDGSPSLIEVTINGLTITEGYDSGIVNEEALTLTNSVVSGNYSYSGVGGIFNNSGILTVTNSTISGNQGDFGGGIFNTFGEVTVTNSTISGNQGNFGGGIFNTFGEVTVTDSTISGNQVNEYGGGILNTFGAVTVTNSTISGNTADIGGGVYNYDGILNLINTIIANSINGGDCVNDGTLATNINNLIEDGTCNPALSGDPNLGPLQDNGGPTFTQALLPGSIAIDAGSNAAIPPGLTTDQRGPGFPRIINGTVDIGAYEASQNVPPPVPEPSSLFGVLTLGLVAIGSVRRRRK